MEKLFVRDEWKHKSSTSKEIPNEAMLCELVGRKMIGDIGNKVCDKRSRRNMKEFLSQKVRIKRKIFGLMDWEAVDIMMENSTQQFCLWVTKHVSKFCGKKYYIGGDMQQMRYAPSV